MEYDFQNDYNNMMSRLLLNKYEYLLLIHQSFAVFFNA